MKNIRLLLGAFFLFFSPLVFSSSIYISGQGFDPNIQQDVAVLWIADTNGSLKNTLFLDPNNYSYAFPIVNQGSYLYIGGQDTDPNTANTVATLWITDLSGSLKNTVFLDPNNTSYVHGIVAKGNFVYMGGQTADPSTGNSVAALWITDTSGAIQSKVLLDPNNISLVNAMTVDRNSLYVLGEYYDYAAGNYVGTLWITDLSGSLQNTVFLDTPASGCTANALVLQGNALYIAGQDTDSNLPTLWITDLNGSIQNKVFLESNNSAVPYDITARGNFVYIVGQDTDPTTANDVATLWVTDTNGAIQSTVFLDPYHTSNATGIAVQGNFLYITGQDTDASTGNSVATLWITDVSGAIQSAVFLDPNNNSIANSIDAPDLNTNLQKALQEYSPVKFLRGLNQ